MLGRCVQIYGRENRGKQSQNEKKMCSLQQSPGETLSPSSSTALFKDLYLQLLVS